MKKTITLLISAVLVMAGSARGQTYNVSPDVIAASGDSGRYNTANRVNWTLGEAVIGFGSYEGNDVTNGFNQAFNCAFIETINWTQGPDSCYELVPDTSPFAHQDSMWVYVGLCWHSVTGSFPHPYETPWCITSVEENPANTAADIELFPNPASEVLTVVIPQNLNPNSVASFFDVNARLIQQVRITASRQDMDVQNLKPGMYFISINANDGKQLSTHKLIKK